MARTTPRMARRSGWRTARSTTDRVIPREAVAAVVSMTPACFGRRHHSSGDDGNSGSSEYQLSHRKLHSICCANAENEGRVPTVEHDRSHRQMPRAARTNFCFSADSVALGRHCTARPSGAQNHRRVAKRTLVTGTDRQGLAPRAGFEPATNRLTAGCSTTELPGNDAQRRAQKGGCV
jgi:hypothetical protein